MAAADAEYRCFVGGLAWETNHAALSKAFEHFGQVVEAKIILDRETGRSRGFGFVTFKDQNSMNDAIEGLNGQDLDGRNITVNQAQERRSVGAGGYNDGRGYDGREGGYGGGRGGAYNGGGRRDGGVYRGGRVGSYGGGDSREDGYGGYGGGDRSYARSSGGSGGW